MTEPFFLAINGLVTLQRPSPAVTHAPAAAAPPLQAPLTVAPATGEWPASWTAIATVACQFFPRLVLEPSRSPTCAEAWTGEVVGVVVRVRVAVEVRVAVRVAVGGTAPVDVGLAVGVPDRRMR